VIGGEDAPEGFDVVCHAPDYPPIALWRHPVNRRHRTDLRDEL